MTTQQSRFDQYITFKALRVKFDDSGHLLDSILDDPERDQKLPIKNVCAKLHVSLVDRLDQTIGFLNISKREFVEMAIIEALDKADLIVDELGVIEELRERGFVSEEKA